MQNNLTFLYHNTVAKYRKYTLRYQKSVRSGRFYRLSKKKQYSFIQRIEKIKRRLKQLSLQMKLGLAAGSMAFTLSTTGLNAQELGPFVENNAISPIRSLSANGSHKNITLGDLDNDGDLDAVFGLELGELVHYENRGNATSPSFYRSSDKDNPFNSITASDGFATPELVDFDSDGDLDLLLGTFDYDVGPLRYFENNDSDDGIIGNNPTFNEIPFAISPINNVQGTNFNVSQKVVDIDDDGDLDVFIGQNGDYSFSYESLLFFENNSGFSQRPLPPGLDDFENFNGLFAVDPDFIDFDGDNDYDLFVGLSDGTVRYYENTGTPTSPSFTARTGASNPFNGEDVGTYSSIVFSDLDNDGDMDAVVGQAFNNTAPRYYLNESGVLQNQIGINNPFNGIDVGYDSSPTFADFDGDGNFDAILGEKYSETLTYLRNNNGVLELVDPTQNPFNDIVPSINSVSHSPEFADIDNDGDLDLFVGVEDLIPNPNLAFSFFFENDGNQNFTTADSPLNGSNIDFKFAPTFADFDGDGDIDAVVGEYNNSQLRYYLNNDFEDDNILGNSPSFTLQTGANDPFQSVIIGSAPSYLKPEFVDIDHDGDFDVVVGTHGGYYNGQIKLIQNNNGSMNPILFGPLNPFTSIDVGSDSDPAFVDFDKDGDLDIFIGDAGGVTEFFENQNEPPEITSSIASRNYLEGSSPRLLNSLIELLDDGDDDIISIDIAITNNFQAGADVLTANVGSTGINSSFNSQTGVLRLSGTASIGDYQSVLRTVSFENTSEDPGDAIRTVTFIPIDFDNTNPLIDAIPETSINVRVIPVNDIPALTLSETELLYTENEDPILLDDALTIQDEDNPTLSGATISIGSGFISSEDQLLFEDQNGITSNFNNATGILALSGSSSQVNYETALRSVRYVNSSEDPNTNPRNIEFSINDGADFSIARSITLNVAAVNDVPVLSSANDGAALEYDLGTAAIVVDDQIDISDLDDVNIFSATVTILGFASGDNLVFDDQNGIQGSFNNGTLDLSGVASLDDYRLAFRSLQFESANPGTKQIQFVVNDGTDNSNLYEREIRVIGPNESPTVDAAGSTTEAGGAVTIDLCEIIEDADNTFEELTISVISSSSGAPTTVDGCDLTIDYSDNDFTGSDDIEIQACDPENACDTNTITIDVEEPEPQEDFQVYNAVSPNNDGRNDWWIIRGLSAPNTIKIYNRWGDEVKELSDYEGLEDVPNNALDDLIAGTYFYKIESPEGSFNGYLTIKK